MLLSCRRRAFYALIITHLEIDTGVPTSLFQRSDPTVFIFCDDDASWVLGVIREKKLRAAAERGLSYIFIPVVCGSIFEVRSYYFHVKIRDVRIHSRLFSYCLIKIIHLLVIGNSQLGFEARQRAV